MHTASVVSTICPKCSATLKIRIPSKAPAHTPSKQSPQKAQHQPQGAATLGQHASGGLPHDSGKGGALSEDTLWAMKALRGARVQEDVEDTTVRSIRSTERPVHMGMCRAHT